jgi:ribonuclease-3
LVSRRVRQAGRDTAVTSRARWAESRLHYRFNDASLLEQALTHRSASKRNNERLEFLGDAFLSFTIARRLYEMRPEASEGDLSRLRAALVKRATLAAVGQEIGVESEVLLGAGERRSNARHGGSILANAVEALIGAVLLDGGGAEAESLVTRLFGTRLRDLPDAAGLKDAKTRLQEWLQARGMALPVYTVEAVKGKAHEQTFAVTCEVPACALATTGQGPSRRHAEQDAATAMLTALSSERA